MAKSKNEDQDWALEHSELTSLGKAGLARMRDLWKGPEQLLPSVLVAPPGSWQLPKRSRGEHLVACCPSWSWHGPLHRRCISYKPAACAQTHGGPDPSFPASHALNFAKPPAPSGAAVQTADNQAHFLLLPAAAFAFFLRWKQGSHVDAPQSVQEPSPWLSRRVCTRSMLGH